MVAEGIAPDRRPEVAVRLGSPRADPAPALEHRPSAQQRLRATWPARAPKQFSFSCSLSDSTYEVQDRCRSICCAIQAELPEKFESVEARESADGVRFNDNLLSAIQTMRSYLADLHSQLLANSRWHTHCHSEVCANSEGFLTLMLQANETLKRPDPFDTERRASEQSLRALDRLNFFKADAQTMVGPYLAIFLLAVRHWDPAEIGMAMSLPGFVTVLAQTPAGALIDWITRKRALVALAALGIGAGCLVLVTASGLAAVALAQGIIAIASIVMPPAIAAISVGLVGRRAFARRMGRKRSIQPWRRGRCRNSGRVDRVLACERRHLLFRCRDERGRGVRGDGYPPRGHRSRPGS